ncbi:MAG: hypothetical protein LC104_19720 [Bacteroidales bacterium]|nr:hypothetical protein [Bacteroidales bacterium]
MDDERSYIELAELAGGFIHEIKNHINTLSLNLQLLSEDFESPETPRERQAAGRIARLTEECRRLSDLANDFLRYARMTELASTPTALGELMTRLADFLAPTARVMGIDIHCYSAPDLPLVPLDQELFEKALLNLMLNAEDAMPNGGTLTLQARHIPNRTLGQEPDQVPGEVVLDVIDTGCGMDAELQAKIFRPFVTTKSDGHGLGLATVRKIVRAHGGQIHVQSEPKRGTKFTIRLPVSPITPPV